MGLRAEVLESMGDLKTLGCGSQVQGPTGGGGGVVLAKSQSVHHPPHKSSLESTPRACKQLEHRSQVRRPAPHFVLSMCEVLSFNPNTT
jgi:hypothetical protein